MAAFLVRACRLAADVGVLGPFGGLRGAHQVQGLGGCAFLPLSRSRGATCLLQRASSLASMPVKREDTTDLGEGESSCGGDVTSSVVPGDLVGHEWTPESRRTGVIAVKMGMTQLWSKEGFPVAVTVLRVGWAGLRGPWVVR